MNIKLFSLQLSVFHGRTVPEDGVIVGYGAIIEAYKLVVPIPEKLTFISTKKRQFENNEWKVFPSRYLPEENLSCIGHDFVILPFSHVTVVVDPVFRDRHFQCL